MKQHIIKINTQVKALIVAGFITIVSLPVFANDNLKASNSTVALQPSVQCIGSETNVDFFSVKFNAINPLKFTLVISDGDGEVLYRETFEATAFSKVFKLVNENQTEATDLTFSLITEDGKDYRFTANKSFNLVSEVRITKS